MNTSRCRRRASAKSSALPLAENTSPGEVCRRFQLGEAACRNTKRRHIVDHRIHSPAIRRRAYTGKKRRSGWILTPIPTWRALLSVRHSSAQVQNAGSTSRVTTRQDAFHGGLKKLEGIVRDLPITCDKIDRFLRDCGQGRGPGAQRSPRPHLPGLHR